LGLRLLWTLCLLPCRCTGRLTFLFIIFYFILF
jgi:hypothetical protein